MSKEAIERLQRMFDAALSGDPTDEAMVLAAFDWKMVRRMIDQLASEKDRLERAVIAAGPVLKNAMDEREALRSRIDRAEKLWLSTCDGDVWANWHEPPPDPECVIYQVHAVPVEPEQDQEGA